jgi:hypothetical protein
MRRWVLPKYAPAVLRLLQGERVEVPREYRPYLIRNFADCFRVDQGELRVVRKFTIVATRQRMKWVEVDFE